VGLGGTEVPDPALGLRAAGLLPVGIRQALPGSLVAAGSAEERLRPGRIGERPHVVAGEQQPQVFVWHGDNTLDEAANLQRPSLRDRGAQQ